MSSAGAGLAAALEELDRRSLRRHREVREGAQSARVNIAGREYVSFASNDYLGLAAHPALAQAASEAARRFGLGAGASHLLTGHHAAHHALERALAERVGMPRALLFSTGYMANLGAVSALMGRGGEVFADRLNHASLNDAVLLSRAKLRRYPHADTRALSRMLEGSRARSRMIATDAVFSMDGDQAPLAELLALAERHDAWLLVDDAHGFGVLGPDGAGSLAHAGIASPRIVCMGTLGKAAGAFGAFVAGDETVVEILMQRARTYIYTTALPPLLADAASRALALMREEGWRRERLARHVALFRQRARFSRWRLLPSQTPIQPVVIGATADTLAAAAALREQGMLAPAIRPPTVPEGSARLRVSLSAAHQAEDVERLAEALRGVEDSQA